MDSAIRPSYNLPLTITEYRENVHWHNRLEFKLCRLWQFFCMHRGRGRALSEQKRAYCYAYDKGLEIVSTILINFFRLESIRFSSSGQYVVKHPISHDCLGLVYAIKNFIIEVCILTFSQEAKSVRLLGQVRQRILTNSSKHEFSHAKIPVVPNDRNSLNQHI